MPEWPDRPALFLDLDGTLLEFEQHPADVRVSARLRDTLAKLPVVTGGAVAIVSGRTLADLDRLLGAGKFPLAAVHGLERRDVNGRLSTTAINAPALDSMHTALMRISRNFPGTHVEHKDLSLALHYRGRPELEQTLFEQVDEQLARLGSELKLMRGNCVLEVKPKVGDKGAAITAFMREEPFRDRTPVFVGDDVTDEDGFRVVNELGGVSVKVDSGPSCARFRLPGTGAVIDWLEALTERGAA